MFLRVTGLFLLFFLLSINSTYSKTLTSKFCSQPETICYKVKKGDSWTKLFEDSQKKEIVMKLNRTNKPLRPGQRIAIPKNFESVLLDVAPFPKYIDPSGKKSIHISLSQLVWAAYNSDGSMQNWGPISGGKDYCPDVRRGCRTPSGSYTIYEKRGPGCFSTKFPVGKGGAPMPYCMFFHKGYALHGSPDVPGYHASHGCVRLFTTDAKWLNQSFVGKKDKVAVIIKR